MNSQKRKKNVIISCGQTASLGGGVFLTAIFLGVFLPVSFSKAEDSLSSALPQVHLSDSFVKKTPFQKLPSKKISPPSLLPSLNKGALNLSPILKQDENHIKTEEAASTTVQGKVATQKSLIGKETQTLSTDTSKETTLETNSSIDQKIINQDAETAAHAKTELNVADQLLNAAKNEATSAAADVTTLKAKKQDLPQSIAATKNNIETNQHSISTLQSQISKLNSELLSASPSDIQTKKIQISQLTTQLQAKQKELQTFQTDLATLKNLTPAQIKQNLAAAQIKERSATQNLQTLETSLKNDQAALQAAQKALNTEDTNLPAVKKLAHTYALQAAQASTNLQQAQAQEKALLAQTGSNKKNLTTLQQDEATQAKISQDNVYITDYENLVGSLNANGGPTITVPKIVEEEYYHNIGISYTVAPYVNFFAQKNQLSHNNSGLTQTIQTLKNQTQAFSQNLQTDQKTVQTDQATETKDVNLSAAEQRILKIDASQFPHLQQKYKSTIAADTTLVAKTTQAVASAEKTLTAATQNIDQLTQEKAIETSLTHTVLTEDAANLNTAQQAAKNDASNVAYAQKNLLGLTSEEAQLQESINTYGKQWANDETSVNKLSAQYKVFFTEANNDQKFYNEDKKFSKWYIKSVLAHYMKLKASSLAQAAAIRAQLQPLAVKTDKVGQLENQATDKLQSLSNQAQYDKNILSQYNTAYKTDNALVATDTGKENKDEANFQQAISSHITADESSVTSLTRNLNQNTISLNTLTSENRALNATLSSDQTSLHQDQTQRTALLTQYNTLTHLTTKINQASLSLQNSRANVQTQTLKLSDATIALQKADQDLTTAEQTETTTTDDLNSLKSQVATLQTTVSQNQDLLDQLQTQASQDENNVTLLQTQQSHLEKEIQTQVSLYNDLVIQANTLKEEWNQDGSLSVLNHYNVVVQKIESVNIQLQTLGGYTLSNLSPILIEHHPITPKPAPLKPSPTPPPVPVEHHPITPKPAPLKPTPVVLPIDTKSTDDDEVVTEEILPQENEGENAQERDAQGDERDDTFMEKQQDMSGGFMPVPGLAGFVGAQAVTGNQTN